MYSWLIHHIFNIKKLEKQNPWVGTSITHDYKDFLHLELLFCILFL